MPSSQRCCISDLTIIYRMDIFSSSLWNTHEPLELGVVVMVM